VNDAILCLQQQTWLLKSWLF